MPADHGHKQGVQVPSSILLVKNFLGQEGMMGKWPITGSNPNERLNKQKISLETKLKVSIRMNEQNITKYHLS